MKNCASTWSRRRNCGAPPESEMAVATSVASSALVMPAAPGFYSRPTRIEQLVDFIVQRIVDQLDLELSIAPRWEGD